MRDECVMERSATDRLADHVGRVLSYVCRRLRYYEAIGDLQARRRDGARASTSRVSGASGRQALTSSRSRMSQ